MIYIHILLYTLMYNTGVAKDKDCVIVDDLVQTGGTLLECAKVWSRVWLS